MDISRILTSAEIQTVLADIKASRVKSGPLHLTIFRLSCCCGLRRKEISGLNIGDLILAGPRPVLKVRKAVTKGRKDKRRARSVPLWWDAGTLADLRAWRDLRLQQTGGDEDQPLVCSVRAGYAGQRLTPKKIAAQWATIIANALGDERAKQVSVHAGRHTYVSHVVARRGLASARDAAGHATATTTNQYLHSLDDAEGDLFGITPPFTRRRPSGQCGYGEWEPLSDLPEHVAAAIADEVAECMAADMRRESRSNSDECGVIEIGGQKWEYRR